MRLSRIEREKGWSDIKEGRITAISDVYRGPSERLLYAHYAVLEYPHKAPITIAIDAIHYAYIKKNMYGKLWVYFRGRYDYFPAPKKYVDNWLKCSGKNTIEGLISDIAGMPVEIGKIYIIYFRVVDKNEIEEIRKMMEKDEWIRGRRNENRRTI